MAWLEITVDTSPMGTEEAAAALTARGFSDLVIEDEQELETFLDENRAYWDYIDEGLQKKLEGLQRIRLYLDSSDEAGMARLRQVCAQLGLPVSAKPLPETDWSENWKDNYPPQEVGKSLIVLPYWRGEEETSRHKIILDPGIGFGKTYQQNLSVMLHLERLKELGYPVLLGTSRKSMIGLALDLPADQRVEGTLVTTVMGVEKGMAFIRVHDVKENFRAVRMTQAILREGR